MGKKFNKLITEAKNSGMVLPYYPFEGKLDSEILVPIDERYDLTFHYAILAHLLPEFIEHLTLERLRSSKKFKNGSLGKKLKLILQQSSRKEINDKLINAIKKCDNKIVKRYFSPKIIEISGLAKEQFDDFMNKYNKMKTIFKNLNNNSKFQNKKSDSEIEQRLSMEAKRIFRISNYDNEYFNEYCKAKLSFTNLYIATGLDVFRDDYFMNKIYKSDSQFTLALNKLSSKPRSFGFRKTLGGLKLYRKYYNEFLPLKNKKKRDPKTEAIKYLNLNDWLEKIDGGNHLAYDEVLKVYTAFFRFVEKSDLEPFDRREYIDYLINLFSEIESKNK